MKIKKLQLYIAMKEVNRYDFLTQEECDTIVNKILSLENAVKRLGPDIYPGTSNDSLTGRYTVFNYLNVPEINTILEPKLKEIFGPCVVQCWANIFRQGEGIVEHKHIEDKNICPTFMTSGNIFLYGDPTTGTYYEDVKHDNKVGELSIFPSDMLHGVPKNTTGDIRISMAIDVYMGDEVILNALVSEMPKRFFYVR
jgi:hypothetical protein